MLTYLLVLSILPFSNPHLRFRHFKRRFQSPIPAPAPICICPSQFNPLQRYQQFGANIFPKITVQGDLDLPVAKKTTEIKEDIRGGRRENVKEKKTERKETKVDPVKAEKCAKMECTTGTHVGPVCACNHITGYVASFGNSCDLKRHNCRFDTDFNLILEQVCPWEFQSRRSNQNDIINIDYSDPKYYNN